MSEQNGSIWALAGVSLLMVAEIMLDEGPGEPGLALTSIDGIDWRYQGKGVPEMTMLNIKRMLKRRGYKGPLAGPGVTKKTLNRQLVRMLMEGDSGSIS